MVKRFWGIYPVYWMSVVVVVILGLILNHKVEVSSGFWKSLLLIPGSWTFVCGVEWTLLYEIVFYCVIVLFFLPYLRKLFPLAALIGFVLWMVKYNGINITYDIPQMLFSRPFVCFFEGILLYFIFSLMKQVKRLGNLWRKHNIICMVLAGITFSIATVLLDVTYYPFYDVFSYYFVIFIAVAVCIYLFYNIRVKPDNYFVKIGNESYGIYLMHPTIMNALFMILKHFGLQYNRLLHILVFLCCGTICYIFSMLFRVIIKAIRTVDIKKEISVF